jgi:predicted ATP-dependent endonuclease of OLD family
MHVEKISVKNFRLLHDVDLMLEQQTTVIVGRNNSGKTSLTEVMRRLLTEGSPTFRLEDFSFCAHQCFWDAFISASSGVDEAEVRT